MGYLRRERLKFYLLIVLIMTSILQVGILWTYKDYGFPINFFSQKAKMYSSYDENDVKSLMNPFKIIVSEGGGDLEKYEASRWILTNSKEPDYIRLWEDAKEYLKNKLSTGQRPSLTNVKDWSSLALAEKSIIYDFKTSINQDLLLWLLDISKISENIPIDIKKIMLAPWQNQGMLYISDDARIYAYSLTMDEEKLKDYDELFNRYSQEDRLKKYTFIKELDPQSKHIKNFNGDVSVIVKGGQYSSIKNAYVGASDTISSSKAYTDNQIEEIADALLGAEKEAYNRTIDSSNTIEFKTQNKIYKVDNKGNFEYKFLTDVQAEDKGDFREALINSYILLSKIRALTSEDTMLYLSNMYENARGSYTLKFDYIIEGLPVVFTDKGKEPDGESAITIETNKKGILNCTAKIKNFEHNKSETLYDMYFGDLQIDLYNKYEELSSNDEIMVKELRMAYNAINDSSEIKPVWLLETDDKKYIVPMRSK